jgi:hypothetical protein
MPVMLTTWEAETLSPKKSKAKYIGGMAQEAEHLLCKYGALS